MTTIEICADSPNAEAPAHFGDYSCLNCGREYNREEDIADYNGEVANCICECEDEPDTE